MAVFNSQSLKKRQQISEANKSVFTWTAMAAIAVAFTLVIGQFLLQQIIFNERVIGEKRHTDGTLSDNLKAADKLKQEVNVLLTNSNLASIRAKSTDSNLQVVLDALPSRSDSLNLAASLQNVFLSGTVKSIDRLTIDTLEQPVSTDETAVQDASVDETSTTPQEIGFSFTVSGDFNNIKNALLALEKSIRPMQVLSVNIEGSDQNLTASVQAKTFYQLAKKVELKDKTVRP